MDSQIAPDAASAKPVLAKSASSSYLQLQQQKDSHIRGPMEIVGEERIEAPREAVWAALNDTEVLKSCVPGCQSLEWTSPTELLAKIKLRLGVLSVGLTVEIALSNVKPPEHYTINAEGKGGVAGFGKASAHITLVEDVDGTILHYRTGAEIGGRIAQMGSRFIGGAAQKLAARFFSHLNTAVRQKIAEA
jgi:carbon monoxide dehydrogenase subunit G